MFETEIDIETEQKSKKINTGNKCRNVVGGYNYDITCSGKDFYEIIPRLVYNCKI